MFPDVRDYLKRTFHLSTIKFQSKMLVFKGESKMRSFHFLGGEEGLWGCEGYIYIFIYYIIYNDRSAYPPLTYSPQKQGFNKAL